MNSFKIAIRSGLLSFLIILGHDIDLVSQHISREGQFFHYTVSDGLPSMEIYDILQDQKGYIWLGTEAGLCRYDGYNFYTYTTKDGLPNNDVIDIEEDSEGRIWINSLGPLAYFEQDSFVKYEIGLRNTYSGFNLAANGLGENWINYAGQVFIIDTTLQLQRQSEPAAAFGPGFGMHRIFKQGKWVWFANKEGLFKFEGRQVIEEIPINFPNARMDGFQVIELNGFIYYTSDSGLIALNTHSEFKEQRIVWPEIKVANQMKIIDGHLWIVSLKKGVFQFESQADGSLHIKRQLLPDEYPSKLIMDDEGNLWVASYGKGLFFLPLNAAKFEIVELPEFVANSMLESVVVVGDKIVVGDLNGYVQLIQNGSNVNTKLSAIASSPVNRILEIRVLPSGKFLIGTDQGLFRWAPNNTLLIHSYPVKNIYIHHDGQVLVNTYRGTFASRVEVLDALPPSHEANKQYSEIFTEVFHERSYSALIDSKNKLWLGNSWTGLTTIFQDSVNRLEKIAPIFNSVVIDLVELDNGLICAATQGDGLVFIKENDFFLVNESNGLSSNICNDLISDGQELWVATNKGISYIREVNFARKSFKISVFNEADGLLSSQVEAIDHQDSVLYMATSKGLMKSNIKDLVQNETQPRIYITNLFINEKSVDKKEVYNLSSDQNNIRIQYVGISYKSHGNLLYNYQLEGIDEDWISTSALETHYSNLPTGNYLFKIAAVGNVGQESANYDEVRFIIHPHFTQTVGFKFFAVLFVLVLLYVFYSIIYNYQQRAKLEKLVAEKTKALNEKFSDLAEINAKLELSNRELQQFAHVASHDLKAPLRNVASFVQLLGRRAGNKLNEEEKEFIQYSVDGVKKMYMIIEDLLSMSKIDQLEQEKGAVPFKEVVNEVIEEMQFQIEEKNASVQVLGNFPVLYFNQTNAKQLWQNLIENALTYQDKEEPLVEVSCMPEKEQWLFGVKDNGIGIAPQFKNKVFEIFQRLHGQNEFVGTGVGLAICKKIVEKNNGKIWCESEEGKGTTFFFTLPKVPDNSH